jgi:hypothetical protein
LTESLNRQWQRELAKIGSVFQNYMLVGTQWGFTFDFFPRPQGFLPKYLANTVVETYLQRARDAGTQSCMACHIQATLPVPKECDNDPKQCVSSNFSFLPGLATAPGRALIRRAPIQEHQ